MTGSEPSTPSSERVAGGARHSVLDYWSPVDLRPLLVASVTVIVLGAMFVAGLAVVYGVPRVLEGISAGQNSVGWIGYGLVWPFVIANGFPREKSAAPLRRRWALQSYAAEAVALLAAGVAYVAGSPDWIPLPIAACAAGIFLFGCLQTLGALAVWLWDERTLRRYLATGR